MNTVDFKIGEDVAALLPEVIEQNQIEVDLFSDELEDRFNAGIGSTAGTVGCALGSSVSTVSSICSNS
jgi:hypothetical protein